jgi:polyisoprenoid-binding protein YceI
LVIGVVAGLVVLIVVGTSIYVHLSTAPAMLALARDAGSGTETSSGEATTDGVWKAGPGSLVGWRVQQELIGQLSPIVGRTDKVWGSITISGGKVSQGLFSVDMAAMTSSLSQTTRRTVFDVGTYPTATLALTSPIELGAIPADGSVERFPATGILTMHGVSHPVRFTASAERAGDNINVLADITFPYGNWNISAQGVPFLADLQSPATIEVLLRLTQGAGNPASVTSPGNSSAGGSQ